MVRELVIALDGDVDYFRTLWLRAESAKKRVQPKKVQPRADAAAPQPSDPPRATTAARLTADTAYDSFSTAGFRATRHRRVAPWAPTVLSIIFVVLSGLVIFMVGSPGGDNVAEPTPVPQATIINPVETNVPHIFGLRGRYSNLPGDRLVWATTFDPVKRRFYPQDKPCVTSTDGVFDCGTYYLGDQTRNEDARYRIDIMFVDARAAKALLQYQIDKNGPQGPNPGIGSLPMGAEVVGSREYQQGSGT